VRDQKRVQELPKWPHFLVFSRVGLVVVPGRQDQGVRQGIPQRQALHRRHAADPRGNGGGVAGRRLQAPLAGRVHRWSSQIGGRVVLLPAVLPTTLR